MTAEEKELYRRILELSQRSSDRGIYTESAFLTEGEQAVIAEGKFPLKPHFEGGFPEAERRVAYFGDEEDLGYPWPSTIALLRIAPKMQKYADTLSHRDLLGALLNLGIRRELLGDILLFENQGFVFVLEHIASYIAENLSRVCHTDVSVCSCPFLPEGAGTRTEEMSVVAASNRLDALVAAVWNLSRSEGKNLVEKEKVMIGGRPISDPSKELSKGDKVSVRGYGKFIFEEPIGETKSGRSRMKVLRYV